MLRYGTMSGFIEDLKENSLSVPFEAAGLVKGVAVCTGIGRPVAQFPEQFSLRCEACDAGGFCVDFGHQFGRNADRSEAAKLW